MLINNYIKRYRRNNIIFLKVKSKIKSYMKSYDLNTKKKTFIIKKTVF